MNSNNRPIFLKQNGIKFFQIFHFSPDAVLLMNKSDKVVMDINKTCEKLIGYKREEIIGQPHYLTILHYLKKRASMKTGEAELKSHRDHLADVVKETPKQPIQSEKMAGIGQLAAGVAHEINNPTGFVISNLQILLVNINQLFSIIGYLKERLRDNSPQDPKKSNALQDCLQKLKESW